MMPMSLLSARLVLCLALPVVAHAGAFLAANPKLQFSLVRDELRGVLSDVLGQGHGMHGDELAEIRDSIKPLFRALPKNKEGHLSAAVMRYAVQRYFSQRHGWIMKGFEPHALAVNESQLTDGSHILQDKVPSYVRSTLEQKLSHDGFGLEDAAVMIASVERLILDEVVRGVETSFDLNLYGAKQGLTSLDLMEVLTSYLITEMLEGSADNITLHIADKENIRLIYPHFDDTLVFLTDIAKNDGFKHRMSQNPFSDRVFFFEDAVRISQRISEDFGPWSNHECNVMKSSLAALDTHETGRVRLSDFYKRSQDGSWQFEEASAYLRQLGAVDDSSTLLGPQVIIPNYISGMSNCITSTPYYSICCLNACDGVYQHLEGAITTAEPSAAAILLAVESMAHAMTGKNVSAALRNRLEEIAALRGGKIPLHGRLLAQWLHYVFPRDCPYPHVAGDTNPQTPTQFEQDGRATSVTEEEVEAYLRSGSASIAPSPDAGLLMWNTREVLLDDSVSLDADGVGTKALVCLRICTLIVMIVGLGGFLLKESGRMLALLKSEEKLGQYVV